MRISENNRVNTKLDHKIVLICFKHCLKYIIRFSVEIRFSEVKIISGGNIQETPLEKTRQNLRRETKSRGCRQRHLVAEIISREEEREQVIYPKISLLN